MEYTNVKEEELEAITGGKNGDNVGSDDCEEYRKLVNKRALKCPYIFTCEIKYCRYKSKC